MPDRYAPRVVATMVADHRLTPAERRRLRALLAPVRASDTAVARLARAVTRYRRALDLAAAEPRRAQVIGQLEAVREAAGALRDALQSLSADARARMGDTLRIGLTDIERARGDARSLAAGASYALAALSREGASGGRPSIDREPALALLREAAAVWRAAGGQVRRGSDRESRTLSGWESFACALMALARQDPSAETRRGLRWAREVARG